jgi:hypothetical protein
LFRHGGSVLASSGPTHRRDGSVAAPGRWVVRGASWYNNPKNVRAGIRNWNNTGKPPHEQRLPRG